MSVKATTWVWEHPRQQTPVDRLVLLAIADAANDGGEGFPGIRMIMAKAAASRSAVYESIARLKRTGQLTERQADGLTVYGVVMDVTEAGSPDPGHPPVQNLESASPESGIPPTPPHKEEPSVQNQEPSPSGANPAPDGQPRTAARKARSKVEPPPEAWELARHLATTVAARFPEFGQPAVTTTWARDVDLLMRKGPPGYERGLDARQVRTLIDWLADGSGRRAAFWRTNVRSPRTLRERAPDLIAGWREDHGRVDQLAARRTRVAANGQPGANPDDLKRAADAIRAGRDRTARLASLRGLPRPEAPA